MEYGGWIFQAIVFAICDSLDALLCPVFRFLDWHLDKNGSPPCHCHSPNEAHVDGSYTGNEFWAKPSHTLYNRRMRWRKKKKVSMIQPFVSKKRRSSTTCWSDCSCETCTAWITRGPLLYVHADCQDFTDSSSAAVHNVIFIHGFLSSSSLWVDTVLPHLSKEVRSSYRLFAIDVLGFGESPRPDDSLYTNAEHVEMIRRSVLEKYGIQTFHLVAHSMGCTIALALAGHNPVAVQSITILAPLYFPTRPGVPPASYVLSNVAPRKVWPFFAFVHALMSRYMLKIHYYFEAVRREYHHPVRVNFFFAPWIAAMFLAIGVPPKIATSLHPAVWCCFMLPIFLLELKIYGQWLSGGQRRLSKVAYPSTHLSVVGNFVGSTLAATVGWTEPALFFWVGLAHYLVLFVTLYQRLPTNETLPSDLHPVFFLFVAAPSAASVAWMRIVGEFDYVSRLVFFISLFLYTSLIVRINFFRGFKFSIAWWAYTFPMTAASIASIQYCHVATSWITRALAVALSFISSATVCTLFVSTLLHVFWWRCLFPNDLAIAITAYKPKTLHFKTSDIVDGCGLFALQHSEPLYKSMLDAYHSFLSARDEHPNGAHHDHDLHRSTTV